LKRHTRTHKHGCAAENFGICVNDRIAADHVAEMIAD
jgi:hypothetical protein